MQFLALLRRRTEAFGDDQFAERLEAEAEQARMLYAGGAVRAAFSRADVPGAALLLEADDEAAARGVLGTLPLVALDMMEVQVIPLRPYRGFGPRG